MTDRPKEMRSMPDGRRGRFTSACIVSGLVLSLALSACADRSLENSVLTAESSAKQPVNQPAETSLITTDMQEQKSYDWRNLKMPILMHHHVGEYSDPADPVQSYLRVPAKKFAAELDLLAKNGCTTITFADILAGNVPAKPVILTFDDGWEDFYVNAYPELKKRGMKAVLYIIVDKLDTPGRLTTAQLMEMRANGIEIGSHTMDHADLLKLKKADIENELSESKKRLEEITGGQIISFAYPYGLYNSVSKDAAKDTGYTFAVTTVNKEATFSTPLDLQRYKVNLDTKVEKLIGGK